ETSEAVDGALLGSSRERDALAAALERDGVAHPGGNPAPIQFVDVFPRTQDRKIHLFPEELDREAGGGLYVYKPEPGTGAYPLALISPSNDRMISSTLGELYDEQFPLELAPGDASLRGIADGDTVRVWNAQGEVHCVARVRDTLKAGV